MSEPEPFDWEDKLVEFTWEDILTVATEEEIESLTDRQRYQLAKAFADGICHGWIEVAETALDIARAEPPEWDKEPN